MTIDTDTGLTEAMPDDPRDHGPATVPGYFTVYLLPAAEGTQLAHHLVRLPSIPATGTLLTVRTADNPRPATYVVTGSREDRPDRWFVDDRGAGDPEVTVQLHVAAVGRDGQAS